MRSAVFAAPRAWRRRDGIDRPVDARLVPTSGGHPGVARMR
jgi:hypothetical protein